jgi:uncharacterized protein YprB with RNaseH-like and TPR domain
VKTDPSLNKRFKLFTRYKTRTADSSQKIPVPVNETPKSQSKPSACRGLTLPGWLILHEFVHMRSLTIPNPYQDQTLKPLFCTKTDHTVSTLCFYDTETTGLSGGAGNVVFLLGLGRLEQDNIVFEQYFLSDFPGEYEFLSALYSKLDENYTYVSYNGSCFDRHILETRYVMHGMQKQLPHQLDLLYPVRRLWKPLIGPCNLHHVEEQILNITRTRDVPGSEIPTLYFEYLRTGNPAYLELVFSHNKHDILSLIELYFKLQSVFINPLHADNIDRYALGTMLLEQQHAQAEALLHKASAEGNHRCAYILSMYYKKQGKWDEALKIWQQLFYDNKNLSAGLELAKYWEHKEKQYNKALSIVEDLLTHTVPHPVYIRKALQHRSRRLRYKISY